MITFWTFHLLKDSKYNSPVIAIIKLILSLLVWTKVIIVSGFYFNKIIFAITLIISIDFGIKNVKLVFNYCKTAEVSFLVAKVFPNSFQYFPSIEILEKFVLILANLSLQSKENKLSLNLIVLPNL